MEQTIIMDEFIKKNNLKLKPQQELAEKFTQVLGSNQMFDFRPEVMYPYLSFENAKPHLKDEAVKAIEAGTEKWEQITSIEKCATEFVDYMKFAWGKAEDERGLSASRSIQKLGMWLWMMDRDDLRIIIEDDNLYNPYGAPALIEVCKQLGIEVPESLVKFSEQKC